MALVTITDKNLREIITADFNRVPCVGESIMLYWRDGSGAPYEVQYVSWTVHQANSKPVEAMISIDTGLTGVDQDEIIASFNEKE